MGILTRAGDLVYTFRFLRLLTTSFKDTTAFKLGIIDDSGKRDKSIKLDNDEKRSAYNLFHRLVFNLKKLMSKVPGGGSKIASYAAALMLIKEHGELSDETMDDLIEKMEIDTRVMFEENNNWLITEDEMLSPGVYRVTCPKVVNSTCEQLVNARDQVRITQDCYPADHIGGVPVYKAVHLTSGQGIYVTAGELTK